MERDYINHVMNNTVAPPLLTIAQGVPEQWAGNQQPTLPSFIVQDMMRNKEYPLSHWGSVVLPLSPSKLLRSPSFLAGRKNLKIPRLFELLSKN